MSEKKCKHKWGTKLIPSFHLWRQMYNPKVLENDPVMKRIHEYQGKTSMLYCKKKGCKTHRIYIFPEEKEVRRSMYIYQSDEGFNLKNIKNLIPNNDIMSEKRYKIVLAGNYNEFRQFLYENGGTDSEYRYGGRPELMLGIEVSEVITYGTFWERQDSGDLYETAMSRVRIPNPSQK